MRRLGLVLTGMVVACGAFASSAVAQQAPQAGMRMPCHNATEIAKQLSSKYEEAPVAFGLAVERQPAAGLRLGEQEHLDGGQHHAERPELHRRGRQELGEPALPEDRSDGLTMRVNPARAAGGARRDGVAAQARTGAGQHALDTGWPAVRGAEVPGTVVGDIRQPLQVRFEDDSTAPVTSVWTRASRKEWWRSTGPISRLHADCRRPLWSRPASGSVGC